MHNGRKGYFFIIDAFIGSAIIIFSLLVILFSGSRVPNVSYNYAVAEEYSSFLLNTKIQDIHNDHIINLTAHGVIKDTRHTLMEQIDEFYYYNNLSYASDLIENITEPILSPKYGLSYTMIDPSGASTILYTRNAATYQDSKVVIVSRKITFLQIDDSTMFGPAVAEIKIWI
jgi:hypothetical protein